MAKKRQPARPAAPKPARNTGERGRRRKAPARRAIARPGDGNGFADSTDRQTESGRTPSLYTIVGIGASAGGVEALTKLLQRLNPDTGLAYVLVQHLAPKHESLLAEVLGPLAKIPVVQAQEQMEILPNRLHVIPPNVHLTVTDGHLHLGPRPLDRTQYLIDSFLRPAAETGRLLLSGRRPWRGGIARDQRHRRRPSRRIATARMTACRAASRQARSTIWLRSHRRKLPGWEAPFPRATARICSL